MSDHPISNSPQLTDEDRAVIAAQHLLISRRKGPGRAIDTSGTVEDVFDRLMALRNEVRAANKLKSAQEI